jgi:hypothetical protein
MLPTSTALSYETCLSINAARLVVDEPPRIELRLSQPVGGSRNESASHLRPVRQDQASRHEGEALGALSMDARQLRRLQSDRGRSRPAELESSVRSVRNRRPVRPERQHADRRRCPADLVSGPTSRGQEPGTRRQANRPVGSADATRPTHTAGNDAPVLPRRNRR